jgi:hypothetical protein
VNAAIRGEATRFRHGRGAMQIHVALSAPLTWNTCDLRRPRWYTSPTGRTIPESPVPRLKRDSSRGVRRSPLDNNTFLTQPECRPARPHCGSSSKRYRTPHEATRPGNSTRHEAGRRR